MMEPRRLIQMALDGMSFDPSEAWELFGAVFLENRYEMANGLLENQESKIRSGLAVRCFQDGRMGFAFCQDQRAEVLQATLAQARSMVQYLPADPARVLPSPQPPASIRIPAVIGLGRISLEEKFSLLRTMEAAARSVPGIQKVPQAGYLEKEIHLALMNSRGMDVAWSRQSFGLNLTALAEADGDSQMGEAYRSWRGWDQIDAGTVGAEAGRMAAGLLGATPLPTARRSLVLPPPAVTGLLEAAFSAWSGEAVQRGRSFLAGREQNPIAAHGVFLVDDGTYPNGVGTDPVDEEGVPTRRTELIVRGSLAGYLYHQEAAARAGLSSTGNARRQGLSTPPEIGPTNLMLLPGTEPPERLLAQAAQGIYVMEILGLHTLDAITGEFSLGINGRLISGGNLGPAVRGMTMAGNVLELMQHIAALGNDLTSIDHFSAPTILVHDMMVAGT